MLMDTGGAITHAKKFLESESCFVLMGVDVLTGLDLGAMIEYHKTNDPLVTLAVKDRKTSRSLLFNSQMQLVGWRDNRNGEIKGIRVSDATSALGFSTIHVINPFIFNKFINRCYIGFEEYSCKVRANTVYPDKVTQTD